jgi:hypothetical protein
MTLNEFSADREAAQQIFAVVRREIESLGTCDLRVTKSQVAFRRGKPFAWVWIPDRYLRSKDLAPLVLSLGFAEPDPSTRWKEIVQPAPGRYMHHLEIRSASEVDDEVRAWIEPARDRAD